MIRFVPGMMFKLHKFQLVRSLLLLCGAFGFGPGVHAQVAELRDGILVVEEVVTAGGAFRAEFMVQDRRDSVMLELIASSDISPSGNFLAASFTEDQLRIPEALIDGGRYWLELENQGDNQFELIDYGRLTERPRYDDWQFSHFPNWRQVHGYAYDVAVAANGSVWVIGTDPQPGGYGIYRLDGFGGFVAEGGALRIDVEPDGRPWVVNFDHHIYRLGNDGFWQRMPGEALDIGIGADGSVWAASFEGIYRWNGFSWDNFGGSGSRIDVGPDGTPWVVGFSDRIYTLRDGVWWQLPGEAGDIGVGADGSVWVIGTPEEEFFNFDGLELQGIYRWNGFDWDRVAGDGLDISVGPNGEPWVTNAYGEIFRAL